MIGCYVIRFGSTTRYCHTSSLSVGHNCNVARAEARNKNGVACEETSGGTSLLYYVCEQCHRGSI